MPTPRLTFRAGPATIALDETGTITSVRHDSRPDWSYLSRAGDVEVRPLALGWGPPELSVDADEVEVTRRRREPDGSVNAGLQTVVRHTFGAGWGVRLAILNPSAATVVLDEVTLSWVAAADAPVWALAAGAVGSYVIAPPDGRGPLLGGTLGLGALESVTPDGLRAGTLTLEPGGRYVVQWHWGWFRSPREFASRRGGQAGDRQLPRTLHLSYGETATITAGDDDALVVDSGVAVEPVRGQIELSADRAGTFAVEVRSARGLTHYGLDWVQPTEVLLVELAGALLAGPQTSAGVVRLADLDAATVVQFGLRVGLDDAEAAEEALDLYAARLSEAEMLDPRTASFLCAEFDRTGDVELVETATEVVLGSRWVVPGLGLAGSQVGLARVVAGLPMAALTERMVAWAEEVSAPPPYGVGPVGVQAAALELAVAAHAGATEELTARVAAAGAWLGAGLKGDLVRPLPVETVAHLAAVLAGLSEEVSTALRRQWPSTAHELGRWSEAAASARLVDAPVGPAHFWLAAAVRTR